MTSINEPVTLQEVIVVQVQTTTEEEFNAMNTVKRHKNPVINKILTLLAALNTDTEHLRDISVNYV